MICYTRFLMIIRHILDISKFRFQISVKYGLQDQNEMQSQSFDTEQN